jgi:hypothetical protein
MDPDTEDAAQFQMECEGRQYNEELANDPGYQQWIENIEKERNSEISRESIERL